MADTGSAVLWVEGGTTIVRGVVVRRGGNAMVVEKQELRTFLERPPSRADWRIVSAAATAVAGVDLIVLALEPETP